MVKEVQTNVGGSGGILALSASDLAKRLGVSLRHIRRMDSSGRLPKPIRLGASIRWPISEIESWLQAGAPDRRTWQAMKGTRR